MKKLLSFLIIGAMLVMALNVVSAVTPTTLFSDDFESGDISSARWTTGGSPSIISTSPYVHQGTYAARLNGSLSGPDDSMISVSIDATGYSDVSVSYWRMTNEFEVTGGTGGEHFYIEYSLNGGSTWTQIEHITTNVAYALHTITLPSGANNNPNIKIRFRLDNTSGSDYAAIDDVLVGGFYVDTTPPTISTPFSVNHQYPTCSDDMEICATVTDNVGVGNVAATCTVGSKTISDTSLSNNGDEYCIDASANSMSNNGAINLDGKTMSCTFNAIDINGNQASPITVNPVVTYDCANPVADFSCTPTSGNEDLTISCTSSSSDTVTPSEELDYYWTFGDGTMPSTAQNPSHTYTEDGFYTVTLTVTDNAGHSDTETKVGYITVTDTIPVASFNANPNPVGEGLNVAFTDTTTYHDPIGSYSWNFGDGATSTLQNPTHAYGDNGVYTVTLTVCEATETGDCSTASKDITVTNVVPNPDAGEYTCDEAQTITLTADAYDVDGDTLSFAWDLDGDKDYDDAFGQSIPYTCGNGDAFLEHIVGVKVTDKDSGWNVDDAQITINNVPPVANANGPYNAVVSQSVCFTGSATDVIDTSFTYEWDFNYDGTFDVSSTSQNPCTSYSTTGVKNIALRVRDDFDYSEIATTTVTVYDYAIKLDPLWNLISIPLVPENDDTSIDNVFGGIASQADLIWSYTYDNDAGRNVWNYNEVEEDEWSDDEARVQNIVPGYGYYLKMNEGAISYQNGNKMYGQGERASPPVVQLTTGWNLIGHYGTNNNVPKMFALNAFSGDYATLLDKDGIVKMSLNPTEGYWLFVKSINTGEYAPSSADYAEII